MNRTTIAPQQPAVAAAARPWNGLGYGFWCVDGLNGVKSHFMNAAAIKRTTRRLGTPST
jgi:hypothetical protein